MLKPTFNEAFMAICIFFCGMAVERGQYLLAIICALCVIAAPYILENEE